MPDDAVEVVESIRTDGAAVVADEVARTVAITDGMVAAEVGNVGAALADHAETSEERHEEILEGQTWLNRHQDLLLTNFQTLQAQVTALQTQVAALMTLAENQLNRLMVLIPSTPLPTTEPEAIPLEEPPAVVAVEDRPVAETQERRARRKVI